MRPLVISFFTQDWEYPQHAKRLERECWDLGIELYIKELESTGSYRTNCGKKPVFILDCLQEFRRPVLWLDVDASILKYPSQISNETQIYYDIAAVRKKPNLDHWYVGSIWFNHTEPVLRFVSDWCDNSDGFADDGVFQETYTAHRANLRVKELDPAIHVIKSRGAAVTGDQVCFIHRISRGSSKHQEKITSKKISQFKKDLSA
jgi:hypothetical protein